MHDSGTDHNIIPRDERAVRFANDRLIAAPSNHDQSLQAGQGQEVGQYGRNLEQILNHGLSHCISHGVSANIDNARGHDIRQTSGQGANNQRQALFDAAYDDGYKEKANNDQICETGAAVRQDVSPSDVALDRREPHDQHQGQPANDQPANDQPENDQPANRDARHQDNAECAQLIQDFKQSIANFSAQQPDFSAAFDFLTAKRDQQLKAYGAVDSRFNDAQRRLGQMQQDAYSLIKAAYQSGRDPAQLIYQIAQNYGFCDEQFYQQISRAQAASKSLTSSPGYRTGQPVNIDFLAEMSQNDFDKWYWNNKGDFRRIMGG